MRQFNSNLNIIINELKFINFNDYLNQTTMEKFFANNLSKIVEICSFLNSLRFTKVLTLDQIDKCVSSHLHPSFASLYQPCRLQVTEIVCGT